VWWLIKHGEFWYEKAAPPTLLRRCLVLHKILYVCHLDTAQFLTDLTEGNNYKQVSFLPSLPTAANPTGVVSKMKNT